jgi:hypothetical protein
MNDRCKLGDDGGVKRLLGFFEKKRRLTFE